MALGQAGVSGSVGAQNQQSQDWNDWKSRAQAWTPPSQQALDTAGITNPQNIAMTMLNRLLEDTNAAGYLSPLYISLMRKNAIRPYMQQQVAAGAGAGTGGQGQLAGNFGDYLKNWMTTDQGGWGNIDQAGYGGMLQGLLNNIGQAKQNARSGQMSTFGDYWLNSPDLMAAAMGLMQFGPGGNSIRQNLSDASSSAWLRAAEGGTDPTRSAEDWIRALLAKANPYGLQY